MCLYDIQGMQKYNNSSYCNEAEATFVCHLCSWLVSQGVDNTQIGVITLYKSQVYSIQSLLSHSVVG